MQFSGVYTALATPLKDDALDFPSMTRLIETNLKGGVSGVVPVGTTGESPTLSHEEHEEVIRRTVEIVAGRATVIAGTGSNCTSEAISLTRKARELGADAALLVAPYYNKPSQEGLFLHYQAVAQAVDLPIILYSIPGRCGIEIGVPTVERLAAACPNIRCIKEAGGSVERVNALRSALPDDFMILSGDDSLTLPFLSAGACGVISVASNLIPAEVVTIVRDWLEGRTAEAAAFHRRLYPLFRDLFIESNPVPVKHALVRRGILASEEVRLPLAPLSPASIERLEATLISLHLYL
jgi:4-hydroxy-tetrahydrodipicolinate synthase